MTRRDPLEMEPHELRALAEQAQKDGFYELAEMYRQQAQEKEKWS